MSGGIVLGPRVAFGAMAKTPIRARGVENALTGGVLTADSIERALGVAAAEISPPTDAIASAWYRKAVLPVHLRRLLLAALPQEALPS
jgi:CO/xanthine dehydrogenase FAD-binding subunit